MINKINIGDEATLSKVFTDADVIQFAKISLDNNPVHLDDEYASKTIFKSRIVQGILVSGLISAVIANKTAALGKSSIGGEPMKPFKFVFIFLNI